MEDELLTPDEAAKRFGISSFTMRDWLRTGVVSGIKVGRGKQGRWRVRASEVERGFREAARPSEISPEEVDYIDSVLRNLMPGVLHGFRDIIRGLEYPARGFWLMLADAISRRAGEPEFADHQQMKNALGTPLPQIRQGRRRMRAVGPKKASEEERE